MPNPLKFLQPILGSILEILIRHKDPITNNNPLTKSIRPIRCLIHKRNGQHNVQELPVILVNKIKTNINKIIKNSNNLFNIIKPINNSIES